MRLIEVRPNGWQTVVLNRSVALVRRCDGYPRMSSEEAGAWSRKEKEQREAARVRAEERKEREKQAALRGGP